MDEIKKILVAIDFSAYSDYTIHYAVSLARSLGAQLIVGHVAHQREISAIRTIVQLDPTINVEELIAKGKEDRLQKIQQFLDKADCKDIDVKTVFRLGIPFMELIDIVKEEGADLVVIGAKGRPNLSSIIFGSTAEKLLRHCPVAVLSLRPLKSADDDA